MKPTKPKSKGGRPVNTARQKHEHDLAVSARRVQQIIREIGLDKVTDMGELRLVEKRVVIALRSIQARREEHDLEIAKKTVIPSDSVASAGQTAGTALSQALNGWLNRMPSELAGLTELQFIRFCAEKSPRSFWTSVGSLKGRANEEGASAHRRLHPRFYLAQRHRGRVR
jgi:hypothetical protein